MLLYCIRHGETTYNAEGRIQGQIAGDAATEEAVMRLATHEGNAPAFAPKPFERGSGEASPKPLSGGGGA